MKKSLITRLFLVLLCFLLPALALAEDDTVWSLWIGADEEPAVSVRLTEEGDQALGLISLFPEYAVIIPEEYRDLLFLRQENFPNVCCRAAQALSGLLDEWLQTLPAADASGFYTGDAFDTALHKREYLLHSSDAVILLSRIQASMSEKYPWLARLAGSLQERWISSPNVPQEGTLQIYNDGEDTSLTLMRGEDVILTLSVRKTGNSEWLLVLGHAENGKTYYHRMTVAAEEKSLDVNAMLLADDGALGYRSLTDQAVVYREELSIYAEENGKLKMTHLFLPADGQTNLMTTGTLDPADPENLYRLEVLLQGRKVLTLEAHREEKEQQQAERTVLLLSELRRQENWPQLYGSAVTQLINRLMKAIPMQLVLQFFME